eukprot:6214081-Pleurochrysis_carterae.AAC.3
MGRSRLSAERGGPFSKACALVTHSCASVVLGNASWVSFLPAVLQYRETSPVPVVQLCALSLRAWHGHPTVS